MTLRYSGALFCALTLAAAQPAFADKKYGPGVTDTEVKVGQTMPYSGPASAYGTQGRMEEAYYAMINAKGGVNGRKIKLISLDDAYSPPKTVEQTRRLVEQDEVLAIIGTIGTPTNSAIQKYLNQKKVPQIFISTGAAKWDDPKNFPWTTQLYPPYQMEGMIFAKYLLKNKPDAKLGVFSQNDDAGKDYVKGLKDGLGDKAKTMIVKEVTYEVSDPTVDSQIVSLKASGADTLFTMATPKFGAQAIRKVYELGWKPLNYVVSVSSSIKGVMEPAGVEASKGLLTALAFKTPTDPSWENAADVKEFKDFLAKWYPQGDIADGSNVTGYISAYMTVKIIEMCGDDLTRENLLKQATNLNKVAAPLLLPGISISTRPDRYAPFTQMQIATFDGKSWVPQGETFNTDAAAGQ
ncbi:MULTISPECIES: ABC transporter substrate-binding protein [Bradyrhizobium]|jgi:branched-chain amino acid transport system substrate-binding protein|uniref:ABC transporter substrate-binding protein n=1 Tax=Bradyrhizobium TaxID=374 RepID=UPI0004828A85|nr:MULTISPECIES: ABC transporter substrate-binding protein [Bradyrhizobium]MCS3445992.1 ABC-type branched-subunit amino acid transport system substrate-binding protein [Bradyrhizobium elkanii]MCS3562876.1 ABC-type branched-subunit amino acid transport system substrate-binding protein [Bradyrhizobium elkanii]MCW2147288.1 ABC-type branched-subunit amino acid transport system substrate-binding protein [Bradyrhizobium elkanii]MCW2353633.1 ABC-type branched-subunit amino acid transport system substr